MAQPPPPPKKYIYMHMYIKIKNKKYLLHNCFPISCISVQMTQKAYRFFFPQELSRQDIFSIEPNMAWQIWVRPFSWKLLISLMFSHIRLMTVSFSTLRSASYDSYFSPKYKDLNVLTFLMGFHMSVWDLNFRFWKAYFLIYSSF